MEYYYLAVFLFGLGLVSALIKKDILSILIGIQMMFLAVGIFLILFSNNMGSLQGQVKVFYVLAICFIQLATGLGLAIPFIKKKNPFGNMDTRVD